MAGKKPKYMIIYQCSECGMDSGYTENDKPKCRYCDHETEMKLISKQEITPELMAERLRLMSDRMFSNLQSAFEGMTDEDASAFPEGADPEKEMLLLLEKMKKFREKIYELELKEEKKIKAKRKKKPRQ